MKKAWATLTILIAAYSPFSIQAEGIGMRGVPNCGDWLESRKAGNEMSSFGNTAVLIGMLNGINITYRTLSAEQGKDMFGDNMPNNRQISAWMDKFCRENPLDSVATGAFILFSEVTNTKPMVNLK
jgi:hypothetical protein